MTNIIVIGGVAAGMSAAAKLKRNLKDNVNITVYEKGVEISYGACGIPFYVSGLIKNSSSLLERSAEEFRDSGIDVQLQHEITAVDTTSKTVTIKNLNTNETLSRPYDKLIVGSGARVRHLPPLDTPHDNLHSIRNVSDGVQLRTALENPNNKNVVIIGAGFIGLEIVEACAQYNKTITLVELAPHILPVMDPDMTEHLKAELTRNNITVLTSSKATEANSEGNRIRSLVIEKEDGKKETIPADLVVNSVGIIPNTEFIDVEKAPNGAILVNDAMETSAADVYAAGDCSAMKSFITGLPTYAPLGTNANKQGRIIAETIAGKKTPQLKLIGASALRLFELDAAKVGLSETDAKKLGIEYKTNTITGNSYASYYGKDKVHIKLLYNPESRHIFGAQIVGRGVVVARANYYAIAISAGMTVDEFGFLDLCYSPPFSGVWDATLIAANTAR